MLNDSGAKLSFQQAITRQNLTHMPSHHFKKLLSNKNIFYERIQETFLSALKASSKETLFTPIPGFIPMSKYLATTLQASLPGKPES
jgi:hypothetical protein